MERYSRNMKTLSKEENDKLKEFKVCVVGCGGLGGYVIEMLGRIGVLVSKIKPCMSKNKRTYSVNLRMAH